jgi:hypothetical protein
MVSFIRNFVSGLIASPLRWCSCLVSQVRGGWVAARRVCKRDTLRFTGSGIPELKAVLRRLCIT